MSNSSEFIWFSLKGKDEYKCLIGPGLRIFTVNPGNTYLLYNSLQDIYTENGNRMKIEMISIGGAPLVLDSDKLELMAKKNDSLNYLVEKFECKAL